MSESNKPDAPTKAVVSVSEMARMVGLSRARFYQLQKAGIFPPPDYMDGSSRPFYPEEQQNLILEARRRNRGINGKPVLFYAQRAGAGAAPKPTRRPRSVPGSAGGSEAGRRILEALEGLGIDRASVRGVDAAIAELFPGGTANVAEAEVIRAVFLHLRRQNTGDNVGR